jgi:hypothetical protein
MMTGCQKTPIAQVQTNNRHIDLQLLFEVDGCKVYRFEDSERSVYLTTCAGRVSYDHRVGKTTQHMESITGQSDANYDNDTHEGPER